MADIVADKDYLSLAQVHAALAYYYMNRQAIDADLTAEVAEYDPLALFHRFDNPSI